MCVVSVCVCVCMCVLVRCVACGESVSEVCVCV